MRTRKSVLLIDDCQDQSFLIERAFRRSDAGIVYPCSSGEAAVAHLERCEHDRPAPDLVLLDRDMPGGMDGFETLRAIRAMPHLAGLPVVMITGSDEHEEEARAAGADDYLIKLPDRAGFQSFTDRLTLWTPEQSWRAKEIVRVSCAPGAVPIRAVDSGAVVMTTPRSADQKLIEFTAACDFAGITAVRCMNLRQTDKVLDAKRRLVVRWLLSVPLPLPWSEWEVRDLLDFSPRYFQERRAENAAQPLSACASRALALK